MTQHQVPAPAPVPVPIPESNAPLFNPRIISRVALIWASITLIAQAIFMGLTGALPESWILAIVGASSTTWGVEVTTSVMIIAGWALVVAMAVMTAMGLLLPQFSKWRGGLHALTVLLGAAFVSTAIPSVALALKSGSYPTAGSVMAAAVITAILAVVAGCVSFAPALLNKKY